MSDADALMPNPTPALKEALANDEGFQDKPLLPNQGRIRFTATKELSKEITGNGIGGHDRIIWDRRYRDSIGEARDKFNELVKKGFVPYLVKKDGTKYSNPMEEFDPDAEEIIMVAPHVGG